MKRMTLVLACLWSLSLFPGCRPASFEIIGKDKKEATGTPNKFGNDKEDPAPPSSGDEVANYLPTARLEAVVAGRATTKVRAGTEVQLQPSYDTLDPDDVGISSCRNPGIVEAVYQGAGDAEKSAARKDNCDPLSILHTFATEGEYEIHLLVHSNEGETAKASMTLTVLNANASEEDLGGFTIVAEPIIAKPGQSISFVGHCETVTKNTIIWAFGDESSTEGRIVTHSYDKTGQYEVDAVCIDENNQERNAKVTVVIMDNPVTPPGTPTPGTPTSQDPDPSNPVVEPTPDEPSCEDDCYDCGSCGGGCGDYYYDCGSCGGGCDSYYYDCGYYDCCSCG